jgi:hypothetical protein
MGEERWLKNQEKSKWLEKQEKGKRICPLPKHHPIPEDLIGGRKWGRRGNGVQKGRGVKRKGAPLPQGVYVQQHC